MSAIPCCFCHDPAAGLCLDSGLGRGCLDPDLRRGIRHRRLDRRPSLCDAAVVVAVAVRFLSPSTESLCDDAGLGEEVGAGGGEDLAAVAAAVSAVDTALCILSRVCGVRRVVRPPTSQGSTWLSHNLILIAFVDVCGC